MRQHLPSMSDDGASRIAWLADQAEKLQNSVVNVHQGLSLAPSLYFSTRRCTYSDVVSIITTVRTQPQITSAQQSHARRHNHADTFNDPLYVNPLQNDRDRDLDNHERYRKALSFERSVFMSKLDSHRHTRHELEYKAACTIQRTQRGHALRKNLDRLKKTLVIRNKVRVAMKDVTYGTGIILEEKDRTRARFHECTTAAVRIQRIFRQRLALAIRRKEARMVTEEVLNDCARVIQSYVRQRLARCYVRKIRLRHYELLCLRLALLVQRLYRGYIACGVLRMRRYCVQTAATRILQNATTCMLATKALRLQASRTQKAQNDYAAIFLQRWMRGFTSRARVSRLRALERQSIVVAASLLIQRVYRGHLGRRRSARRGAWRAAENQLLASMAIARAISGFLGRCRARTLRLEQQVDVFIQARRGNQEAVVDLLDGLGIEAPLDPNGIDHNGNTVLCIASRFGHLSIVRSLITRVRLDAANRLKMTPIMLAVHHGHADVADYLLTKNPELVTTGRTVLHDAARNGMLTTVEQLLLHGLSGTTQDAEWRRTPLHEAVRGGNLATVQFILDHCPKATVNYQDLHGATVLHYAARTGSLEMVIALLLCAGADVSILDGHGQTAWRVALSCGHDAVASEIRKRWSLTDEHEDTDTIDDLNDDEAALTPAQRVAAALEGPLRNLEHLLEMGIDINERDTSDGRTMLMKASMKGFTTVVRFCLQRGATIDEIDNAGRTALLHSAPHSDVALYLLSHGANILHQDDGGRTVLHEAASHGYTFSEIIAVRNIHVDIKDNAGLTPLHDAAKVGSAVGAKKLLNLGARVSCVDLDDQTPIHYAAIHPSPAVLRVLLRAEARAAFLRDQRGRSAVFVAIERGHIACVEMLRAFGVTLDETDPQNATLLHAAIASQQDVSVDYLLAQVPVIECTEPLKGSLDTPLHLACRMGYVYAVDKLLSSAADPLSTRLNAVGDSPLQTATRCGRVDVISTFISHGFDLTVTDRETGASLLHVAAEIDTGTLDPTLVPLLVHAGVSLTLFDKKGWQPLHIAATRAKGAGVVQALIAAGAPANGAAKNNMTPYHCAAQMGIGEIIAIFKANGVS